MEDISWSERYCDISCLKGRIAISIKKNGESEILFEMEDGAIYEMRHEQNCCESVYIESIVGDLEDLIGEEILLSEEVNGESPAGHVWEYEPESYTWTFYKFATRKGYVDIRWLGESNGYYSEGVSFVMTKRPRVPLH